VVDRPEGYMEFRFEAYEDDGRIVCGVYDIKGEMKAGPKAFVTALREEMRNLEQSAKANGAHEFRIGGRWGRRVVPDYEPYPDPSDPLRRRKVL
jgi:hypothetical protein